MNGMVSLELALARDRNFLLPNREHRGEQAKPQNHSNELIDSWFPYAAPVVLLQGSVMTLEVTEIARLIPKFFDVTAQNCESIFGRFLPNRRECEEIRRRGPHRLVTICFELGNPL